MAYSPEAPGLILRGLNLPIHESDFGFIANILRPPTFLLEAFPVDLSKLKINREPSQAVARKRPVWRWVFLVLFTLTGWWFRSPLERFFEEARLPKVQVVEAYEPDARSQAMASGLSAGGYVVARKRAALSSDVPGRIVEMNVSEGSVVKKDQVVARLAHSEQEARLAVAVANVKTAQAGVATAEARLFSLEMALPELASAINRVQANLQSAQAEERWSKSELDRYRNLRSQKLGNESEFDGKIRLFQAAEAGIDAANADLQTARAAQKRGRAEVSAAQASVLEAESVVAHNQTKSAEAQTILDKTFVRAPFDGVVVLKDAEVGEVVSPNSQGGNSRGSVATLVDLTSLEAQVELPEVRISSVRLGGTATVYLDAYPDLALAAHVDRIWPAANRQKATVEVRLSFDVLEDRIRPEMGLRVVFDGESTIEAKGPEPPSGLRIPERALLQTPTGNGVFVLQGERVRWLPVTEFERLGGQVILGKGDVKAGDRVVLSPPGNLSDGDRVLVPQP
ncbi:MAG: HlyD family secretion protein [Planctomycetota bacterium]|jgi:HlyD family secretion protein